MPYRLTILFIALLAPSMAAGAATPVRTPVELEPALAAIDVPGMLGHIRTLASDAYGGRAPGTPGETLTVAYLTQQFQRAGLQPGNPDGSYVQRVPLVGIATRATLSVAGTGKPVTLDPAKDFVLRSHHRDAEVNIVDSPIVFVGYGISAPEHDWDDFAGLHVRGKTLLMLDGEPEVPAAPGRTGAPFKGKLQTWYSTRDYKFNQAARLGAAGVFVVHDVATGAATFEAVQNSYRREFFELRVDTGLSPVIEGWLTREAVERLFRAQGLDFAAAAKAASVKPAARVALGATLGVELRNLVREVDSFNVVARLEGSDPVLKASTVAYSAHWDHLGTDPTRPGDTIYNGAIDNAGGVAALLEIAEGFARLPTAPNRSLLFMATTAEELGLLGARYYAAHPLYPLASTMAVFNLDAFNAWGPTRDVMNMGLGLTSLDEALDRAARMQGRNFVREHFAAGAYYFYSDQLEFAKVGIPSAFPGSGSDYVGKPKDYGDKQWGAYGATGYHQVDDEVKDDWDLSGAVQDARWLLLAGHEVAQSAVEPSWSAGAEFSRPTAPAAP